MDPEIQALLDRIQELSDDELADLESRSVAAVEDMTDVDSNPDADLEAAQAYADVVRQAREETQRRIEAAEERKQKAAEIKALITPEDRVEPEEEPEEQPAEETAGEPAEDAEVQPAQADTPAEEAPQAVAAAAPAPPARPSLAAIRARVPISHQPKPKKSNVTIVAAGDIPGFSAGQKIRTIDELGNAFGQKAQRVRGTAGSWSVASIETPYPDDRSLVASAMWENTDKIRSIVSREAIDARVREAGGLEPLLAAGGLCAPVDTRYDLSVVAVADRPVRDALAKFQANRGGIQFMTSATLGDTAGGVDIITEAEDTSSTSKPIVDITCGTLTEELVDAVTLRLRIGNWNSRFYPELFRSWYELALAQHAREAESRLLQRIAAASTAVTDGRELGASRDILESYIRFAAQQRNRLRMRPDAPMTVLLPAWVRDMFSADLLRQAPGDNTLAITYQQVESMFRARALDVNWYLDEETGGSSMIYVAEAGGAGNPWITSVIGYMFPAGTFLFLDGGRLDLGVEVRDSTLNAANQVEAFLETFEGVARVGQQSLKVTNTVCVSGEFSAGLDFTCPGSGS